MTKISVGRSTKVSGWHLVRTAPAALLLTGTSAFFGFSSFFLLAAALPLYFQEQLGFDLPRVGMVIGSTYLLNFVAYLFVGSAVDRARGGRLLVASALALAVTAPLLGVFSSVAALAAVALLQGLTMSAYSLVTTATAGQVARAERRGFDMGLYGMFNSLGAGLAPAIGIAVYRGVGPDVLFGSAAVAGLCAAAIGIFLLPRLASMHVDRVVPGMRWRANVVRLAPAAGTTVAIGVAYGLILAFMPGHLATRGIANPGLFYAAELVTLLTLRTPAGALSDRIGRVPVIAAGLLTMGTAVFALGSADNVQAVVGAGLLSGAGWALFAPAVLAWFYDDTASGQRGLATATYFISLDIGRVLGSSGMGYLGSFVGVLTLFQIGALVPIVVGIVAVTPKVMRAWVLQRRERHVRQAVHR